MIDTDNSTANPQPNTLAAQGYARVVNTLDGQVRQRPPIGKVVQLNEVLVLAETMRRQVGDLVAPILDRAWRASEAIDKADAQISGSPIGDDLLDVDPEELTRRAVEHSRDRVVRESPHRTTHYFRDELARLVALELREAADATVVKLRSDFDKHLKVIATAARLGISKDTDRVTLLETGTTQQIEAYRGVDRAAAGLDQIAGLRVDLARVLRYGPLGPEVAYFVTGIADRVTLEGAEGRYEHPIETVNYVNPEGLGNTSTLTQVRTARLGGRWLDLVHGGYSLHLNTAAEADRVIASAQAEVA